MSKQGQKKETDFGAVNAIKGSDPVITVDEDINEKNGITWASGNEFEYELKIKRTKHVADRRDL